MDRENVGIGYIQFDVTHDKEENLKKVEDELQYMDCDIVVLPELCMSGFIFDTKDELIARAEPVPGGSTVKAMEELSAKYNCTLVFGLSEIDDGKIYDTAAVVSKGKYIDKYRKIHLSDFVKNCYTEGDRVNVIEVDGVKLGVQICFDLWFPEISRMQVLDGAEMICCLCSYNGNTTEKIASVRAIENRIPIIVANRMGCERTIDWSASYMGNSVIIGANGHAITDSIGNTECSGLTSVDLNDRCGSSFCEDFMPEITRHHQGGPLTPPCAG